MADPYETLGVRRGDSDEAIHSAYRKLAKRHHPDLNQGKPEAAERFKTINAAHDLLSDPEKRARFDRGEIDAEGRETAAAPEFHPGARAWGRAGAPAGGFENGFSPDDLESILSAFGGRTGGFRGRGSDVQYALTVDFLDSALGAVKRLSLPDGRTLDVTIPAGLKDGHVLRLKGQGEPGIGPGMPRGDALVEITVAPHALFRREGDDILLELPVTLREAVLGAAVDVPTIKGSVRVTVPPNSDSGTKLRLRGRGIRSGNQVVTLKLVLPPKPEPELEEFLKNWSPAQPYDPRAGFEEASRHGGGP